VFCSACDWYKRSRHFLLSTYSTFCYQHTLLSVINILYFLLSTYSTFCYQHTLLSVINILYSWNVMTTLHKSHIKARYWSTIASFHTHLHPINTPVKGFPSQYCRNVWNIKTKMVDLPDNNNIIYIISNTMFMVLCCHKGRANARVHPVHLMNVEWRQAAADPRPSQMT